MKETEDILCQCGLTRNEAKAYLALLKLKKADPATIAKEANIHRVNAYDTLRKLTSKGFIAETKVKSKKEFVLENPEYLKEYIQEKEKIVNEAIPEITKIFQKENEQHEVMEFSGPAGILNACLILIKENKTYYALGGSGKNREYLKHKHQIFKKKIKESNIKIKALYYEFTRHNKEKSWDQDSQTEIKFIPDEYKTECMIDFCGDVVLALIPSDKEPKGILIRDKKLAEFYKNMFELIWKNANI